MRLYWSDGNPAGYTDDLGIIADRNQWIEERAPGWYLFGHSNEVHEWCKKNLKSYTASSHYYRVPDYFIEDDKDVILFRLRWSVD